MNEFFIFPKEFVSMTKVFRTCLFGCLISISATGFGSGGSWAIILPTGNVAIGNNSKMNVSANGQGPPGGSYLCKAECQNIQSGNNESDWKTGPYGPIGVYPAPTVTANVDIDPQAPNNHRHRTPDVTVRWYEREYGPFPPQWVQKTAKANIPTFVN